MTNDKQRERLVELLQIGDETRRNPLRWCDDEIVESLADYLLANGIIVLPCKVGDMVYKVVNDKRVKKPYECKVVGFWYSEDENCNNAHLVRYVNDAFDCSFSVPFTAFGKTVFLTREEAETKLRKEQKDE